MVISLTNAFIHSECLKSMSKRSTTCKLKITYKNPYQELDLQLIKMTFVVTLGIIIQDRIN